MQNKQKSPGRLWASLKHKKEQLKQLETVINDVVLQEVINKTPLTKEKMLRKLLLEAIKNGRKNFAIGC